MLDFSLHNALMGLMVARYAQVHPIAWSVKINIGWLIIIPANSALFSIASSATQSTIDVQWPILDMEYFLFILALPVEYKIVITAMAIHTYAFSVILPSNFSPITPASHALSVIATNAPTMFPSAPSAIRASICLETYVHPTTFRTVSTVPSSASAHSARTGSAWWVGCASHVLIGTVGSVATTQTYALSANLYLV